MKKSIMAISLTMVLFAFGCSGNPVDPIADEPALSTRDNIEAATPDPQPGPAAAVARPFRGFDMTEWKFVGATSEELFAVSTGTAYFTHSGKNTFESEFTLTLATGVSHGTTLFTAANGDQTTSSWTSTPTSLTERLLDITVTGGTGRFANATGSIIGHLTILSSDASGGTAEATYEGTISY